jgi:hypothetical protein
MASHALHCAALLLVFFATTVRGWDCVGHMLTTMIALNLSPDNVRSTYQPLFEAMEARYENLSVAEEVACWPDDARSFTDEYAPWHYQDTCYSPFNYTCGAPQGDLFVALAAAQAKVMDTSLPVDMRGFWLSFIVHLVGDAHQPLHLCTFFNSTFPTGDLGGNSFYIKYQNKTERLHSWCDEAADGELSSHLVRPIAANASLLQNMRNVAAQLQARFPVTAAEANDLSQADWLSEALNICAKDCYLGGTMLSGSVVNDTYITNLRTVLLRRIVVGGTRLAKILADSIPPPPPGPSDEDTRAGLIATIVVSSVMAVVIGALIIAACAKRGMRRHQVDVTGDMPYETVRH